MKNFLKFLFISLVFLLIIPSVYAQEQIQSFATRILINQDGTMNVSETVVYDFGNLQKHGIYRNIPYIKTNNEGKKFRLKYENLSVVDENNNSYQFSKSTGSQQLSIKIGDPDKTVSGVHTYIIRYKVYGALTYFSDHDELYWNATGNDWTIPIESATPEVELPVGLAQDEISANCYVGYEGSTSQDCEVNKIDNRVNFKTNNLLESGQGLTLVVGFPKNIVAVLEPEPYISFWETIFGKIVIAIIILAAIIWYLIYPIWIPVRWLREGRDPSTRSARSGQAPGIVRAWYDPPRLKVDRPLGDKNNRFLTPEETGALVDERADIEDISAMIVSLAQKGFLKIKESEKNNFSLIKRRESGEDFVLLPFEENFLDEIFQESDEVSLKKKNSNLYTAVEEAKKSVYEELVKEGFFPENPNKIRTFYTIIGSLALITLNFPLAFSAFFFGRHMPKKTHLGVSASQVGKSLRNFLSSQERQFKFQAKNQMFFERLLPYAVAFGVEKIWAERFKDIHMKPPDWYQGYSAGRFNSLYFTNSLNSSFSSFQSAATPTTSSSGFGSGFSGGSSGGGGGGGGGGSW